MRSLALLLVVFTALVIAAPTASAAERPDARMLLDLDLLHDTDPRLQRDRSVAESRPLLEFLQRIERAALERSRRDAPPPPSSEEAC